MGYLKNINMNSNTNILLVKGVCEKQNYLIIMLWIGGYYV